MEYRMKVIGDLKEVEFEGLNFSDVRNFILAVRADSLVGATRELQLVGSGHAGSFSTDRFDIEVQPIRELS